MNIKEAIELENKGNYLAALKIYETLFDNEIETKTKLYIERSIAACHFYLKNYTISQKLFENLLSNNVVDDNDKIDIKNCLHICYLYSGNYNLAYEYFIQQTNSESVDLIEKMWANWYVGQIYYNYKNYIESYKYYDKAYSIACEIFHGNVDLFFSHAIVSQLHFEDYLMVLNKIEKYKISKPIINSYGLLYIAHGINLKITNNNNWYHEYNKGIIEAQKCAFIENIDLGKELLKEFG